MAFQGRRTGTVRLISAVAHVGAFLLLLLAPEALAQTLTVAPEMVDPAKPLPVKLMVLKADGASDPSVIAQVQSVKVGDQPVKFLKDADSITIAPPQLSPGPQPVQLLDGSEKVLVKGQLRYGVDQSGSLAIQELSRRREEDRRDNLVKYTWYYLLVTLMFLAVLIPFVLAIYRGTSASPASAKRPLGLPVGSFRAILAYSLVAYLGFYVLTSILSVSPFLPPDFLMGIVATVIGFYFGSRSSDEGDAEAKTGTARGVVRLEANPARGALVKFKRSSDGVEPYSRISDVDGRFELRGAAPGQYKVTAALGDAKSDEQEITIVEASDHEIELALKRASAPSTPEPTGAVEGTVMSPDDKPAAGASVVLLQDASEKFKGTTGADGRYKIANVTPGDYDAVASLQGYAASEKSRVTVTAGGQHTVALKLKLAG